MENKFIDARQEFQYRHPESVWGCFEWILGMLIVLVLFGIFLVWYAPKFSPKLVKVPRQAYQTLTQLTGGQGRTNPYNPVAILMYHYVREVDKETDPTGYHLSVSPTVFQEQMEFIKNNYNVIGLADFISGKIPDRAVILTFDDGYEDFYTQARPILQKYRLPASVFMITGKIGRDGYLTASQIKKLAEENFSIGSHTVNHPNLSNASYERQSQEISQSKQLLESITGQKMEYFVYPSGEYNEETLKILRGKKYKIGLTTQEALTYRHYNWLELPRLRVSGSMGVQGLKDKLNQFFENP